jgi:hypothetical protein
MVNLLGAHIRLKIARTATGSVADIKLQKSKHTKKGTSNPQSGNKKYNKEPITEVDMRSHPILKAPIVFQLLRRCL